MSARAGHEPLPAWSLPADAGGRIALPTRWPHRVTRDWAWGDRAGRGVRVCILDSGIELDHPEVGEVASSWVVTAGDDGAEPVVVEDGSGDLCGHGTACAGIVRSLAPECEIHSVRVLGAGYTGSGPLLLGGLRWAVEQGFDIVNMSLSTTKRHFAEALHELADRAYFQRTVLVASAHNMPVESYPWRFASVVSVGSHEQPDSEALFYNPSPPVEFFARGMNLDVPWLGGGMLRCSGNSFATPHVSGLAARVLGAHPEMTPFQLKTVLYLTSDNVEGAP